MNKNRITQTDTRDRIHFWSTKCKANTHIFHQAWHLYEEKKKNNVTDDLPHIPSTHIDRRRNAHEKKMKIIKAGHIHNLQSYLIGVRMHRNSWYHSHVAYCSGESGPARLLSLAPLDRMMAEGGHPVVPCHRPHCAEGARTRLRRDAIPRSSVAVHLPGALFGIRHLCPLLRQSPGLGLRRTRPGSERRKLDRNRHMAWCRFGGIAGGSSPTCRWLSRI